MWQWHLASTAVGKLSDSSDLNDFLISTIPVAFYTLVALALWMAFNHRGIKRRRVSLRAFMFLIGMLSPGLVLLKWVYWSWT